MDTRINGLRFVVEGGGGDDAGRIPISDCDFMSIGLPSPSPPPTTRMASDNFMSLKKKRFPCVDIDSRALSDRMVRHFMRRD